MRIDGVNQSNYNQFLQQSSNYSYLQAKNRTDSANTVKAAKGDDSPKKENPVSGESGDTVTISTAAAPKVAAISQSENSALNKLKQTFGNVNFVVGKDPFEAKDVRNNGRNTVYLDAVALNKMENDPRYAARVFAEIESSMGIVEKGYSYSEGDRTYTLQGGALNLSFYGKGESSKLVATMIVFDADGKPDTPFPLLSLMESPGESIHRRIAETANSSLKKWFDAFNVSESERRYYDGGLPGKVW